MNKWLEIFLLRAPSDLLKQARMINSLHLPIAIAVRRSHLIEDALKEAKKEKFNSQRLVKVRGVCYGGEGDAYRVPNA